MSALPLVTLRHAGARDRAFAYRVRKAAFEEYVARLHPWDEDEQRRIHDRRFDEYPYRIIQVDGRDVGVLLADVHGDEMRVRQLFVQPDQQRKGVGAACMNVVLGEAQALGLPVRLRVLKVNPRAQGFFARLGFTRTGETATHILLERRK